MTPNIETLAKECQDNEANMSIFISFRRFCFQADNQYCQYAGKIINNRPVCNYSPHEDKYSKRSARTKNLSGVF